MAKKASIVTENGTHNRMGEIIAEAERPAPTQQIQIRPPQFRTVEVKIEGTAPFVQLRFSQKAQETIRAKHAAGGTAGSKRGNRAAKDFDGLYQDALYRSDDGKYGIPASAFRNAMIDACRTVGYKMTHAKMAAYVVADGLDVDGTTPLVYFTSGEPSKFESITRNANGEPDIRVRGKWAPGWTMTVRVRFDSEMLTVADVVNLLARVGEQVGVGEGRPFSKNSAGMGWGTFRLVEEVK